MNDSRLSALRKAGSVAAQARDTGGDMIEEGATYLEVAESVEGTIRRKGAKPAFPVNIGVNEVAAHYTPSSKDRSKFSRGDLVKMDVGAHVDGYIGDTAVTVEVGTRNKERLIESANRALTFALEMISVGTTVSTIGGAIEKSIRGFGYEPVTNLTGHGMEKYSIHAGLTIPNIDDGDKSRVEDGMVIAVEPFATDGKGKVSNGKGGNIYRVLRERHIKDKKALDFFSTLREEFGTLPFCERWCVELNKKAPKHLRTLVRHGLISSYPVLEEVNRGLVSQAEHTIVLNDSRVEITTN